MKSKIKTTDEPKQFKPFTLEITVETIQEARALFHVLNHYDAPLLCYEDYAPHGYSLDFNSGDGWNNASWLLKDAIKQQGFDI